MTQQPPVGQGLLIFEALRSHSDTPHSVGFLWTSDQPDAETSTWQHTTLTRDRHPRLLRDANPQSQQASGCGPKPKPARPLGSAPENVNANVLCKHTAALVGPYQLFVYLVAVGFLQPIKLLLVNISSVGLVKSFSLEEIGVKFFNKKRIL